MKKMTSLTKSRTVQKSDSRKEPSVLRKSSGGQQTPAGERTEPVSVGGASDLAALEDMRTDSVATQSSLNAEEAARAYDDSHHVGLAPAGAAEPGGFQLKAAESRRERVEHEKGHIEELATHHQVPPAQSVGQPGSAPRIMQRRSVYERGNRYPRTHAPKA